MLEEFINDIDFNTEFLKLLEKEVNICEKLLKDEGLTFEEFIFYVYLIKPSTLLSYLIDRLGERDV